MVYYDTNDVTSNVWLVNIGCSNTMIGHRTFFKELDETKKMEVKLGDNKEIQVEGNDTVAIKTS